MFKLPLLFLFVITPLVFAQSNDNQSEQEIEANIARIQKKLTVLKTKLNSAYGEEQVLIVSLEQQDKAIGEISKKVKEISKTLDDLINQINSIDTEIKTSKDSIREQKNQIVKLLKLQVYITHDKTLRMLLANKKTASNIQTKHQLKYLQNRMYLLIKAVSQSIQQLEGLKQEKTILQDQEIQRKIELTNQQSQLLEQRKKRLVILKQLKDEISKHENESSNLNKDQKRLQELLNEIQLLLSDLPKDLGSNKPFNKLKGKLIKPVKGKYIRSFNSRRSEHTRWKGVVIKADLGKNVEAVAYGRVAFADWLRGFGLLVIIDHQDGYMSLYGFNESLNVEVGDWVEARQNISNVGNSGNLVTPALYFEIRKDAKPLNPKSWVK